MIVRRFVESFFRHLSEWAYSLASKHCYNVLVLRKGKPAARRGRKATGLFTKRQPGCRREVVSIYETSDRPDLGIHLNGASGARQDPQAARAIELHRPHLRVCSVALRDLEAGSAALLSARSGLQPLDTAYSSGCRAAWVESPVESTQSGEIRLGGDHKRVGNLDLIVGRWPKKRPLGRLEMA